MKHTRYFGFFIPFVLTCLATYAQQDSQFSMFTFNQLYFNPATVGSDGMTRLQLLNRWQYQGYQTSSGDGGAPTTFMASVAVPLSFVKGAIGIHYVNDQIGVTGSQEVQLSYAYKMNIKDNTLALGVRVGLMNRYIDFSRLNPRETGDPQIPTGRIGLSQPDFALGAYYDATDFYVGLSINHLNSPQFRFTGVGDANAFKPNIYLNAGYRWQPTYELEIQPVVLAKSLTTFSGQTISVEGGVIATYNDLIFLGGTYRLQDAISATIGGNLLQNRLRVAFSHDFVTSGQSIKTPSSNEFMLSYALPAPRLGKKTIVRTPRFRY